MNGTSSLSSLFCVRQFQQPLVCDTFKDCEGFSRVAFLDGKRWVLLGKVVSRGVAHTFQPQQWPRSLPHFSLIVKGDWRQEAGRSTLSLNPNVLAKCSLPFGLVQYGREACRISTLK